LPKLRRLDTIVILVIIPEIRNRSRQISFLNPNKHITDIFRSLKYRNYRLFFCGQSISLIGTWMQRVAMSWLVYRLSNSAVMLGIVAFSGQIPTFLLTPFGGVAADRYNRHRLLLVTQILATIQAVILATLVLTGVIAVWHLIILSIALGVIRAFDMPIRQAFVIHMIDKREDLGNAIALNSSMVNAARLVGPSVAGMLIATVGEGVCFTINAASYLVVITTLVMMSVAQPKNTSKATVLQQLKDGFSYALGFAPVKYLITLLALLSLAGMPYIVLMPIFARDILHGSSRTFGFLMAASGVGALTGAIYLARRKTVLGLGKVIVISSLLFGVGIIGFSLSTVTWLSMLCLLLAGLGMILQLASSNTLLQTIVEDDMRGRVMSIYAMAFVGAVPFGSLIAGYLASRIGAVHTLIIGGTCCLVGSLLFFRKLPALRRLVHPIYVRKGIIPAVSEGLQTATELRFP
jgi:MFS family permease